MTATAQSATPRLLDPKELAAVIKVMRELRGWSQEQLADIAGLSARTVQRTEAGEPSGRDTRRALARAFDAQDIDAFSKPYVIPTEEEIKSQREQFQREHMTLKAHPVTSGRQLAGLVEQHSMDLMTPGFDMEREAEEEFAGLIDYLREYRDCHDLYQEAGKFEVYDAVQTHIDALAALQVSLRYAERNIRIGFKGEGTMPVDTSALYLVTFRLGKEPQEFVTPRKFKLG